MIQAMLAQQGAGYAFSGLMIVFIIIAIIASIFWLWMLIDCLTSNLPPAEKLLWTIVILFLHLLGALIYYFVARPGGRNVVT